MKCLIDNCDRKSRVLKMCDMHYRRSKRCNNDIELIGDDQYWYNRSLSRPDNFSDTLSKIRRANPIGHKHTEEHKQKMKDVMKGEHNAMWKGNNVSYKSLHTWVNRHLPKPSKCPNCNENKRLHAANISGKYLRDITDYEYLCQKCHFNKYHKEMLISKGIWGKGLLKAKS